MNIESPFSLVFFYISASVALTARVTRIQLSEWANSLTEALQLTTLLHSEGHPQVHFLQFTGDFFEEWNEIIPQTHLRKFEEQMA